ncbi:MAG: electron transfer flavoprotein subunit alpha/FixB family protein [Chloroflexi bacterium]|nr:electron transfer flavoprotein subunit alpha/FixB family protein [Chloroflexota bacterium]MYC06180.1 electron transfer flavoprotein subunit alpha/FixB family protein [Chloroflexota bacterium]
MAGVLVVGELNGDALQSITGELLAAGRGIGDASGEEVAVVLLNGSEAAGQAAIALGADKAYLAQDDVLADLQLDAQVAALAMVCNEAQPSVVLVGRTLSGRDVGPRLAFRLGVGLAQDCLEVEADGDSGKVVAVRPVYGGNALAKVTFPDASPQMVVLRAKAYEPLDADDSRTGEIVVVNTNLDPSVVKARLVETVRQESEGVRLEDANVVIGGGRGLGGPEPFDQLEDLAGLLGGAVGASRAVCDAGWLDHSYQVGLTGKTITPDLYITVGISGASQHMAGCSASKNIVAINRDEDANIFKSASFGVVGDWKNVLPSFIETVRELVDS